MELTVPRGFPSSFLFFLFFKTALPSIFSFSILKALNDNQTEDTNRRLLGDLSHNPRGLCGHWLPSQMALLDAFKVQFKWAENVKRKPPMGKRTWSKANESAQTLFPDCARMLGNTLCMKGEQEGGFGWSRHKTIKSQKTKKGLYWGIGVGLAAGQPALENPGPQNPGSQGPSDLLLVFASSSAPGSS